MATYAVIGATSWGVTIASLLARDGGEVDILVRAAAEAEAVNHRRGLARLPEVTLPPSARARSPLSRRDSYDGLVVAVPAQHVRSTVSSLDISGALPVLSAAKGIEHSTLLRMSEVLMQQGWAPAQVSVLSGPNLAHEVGRGLPAAAVVASTSEATATAWQLALSRGTFRCYRSADVIGTEIGGALKNVIAIAAGAAAGLQLGANAMAAIMTRGLAEMTRLGVALGADPLTFQGLAGIGDLAVTCYSPLSRNHRLGEMLARGLPPAEAIAQIGESVEGVATAPAALALARRAGVEAPIMEQVVAVLAGEANVGQAMARLLSRGLRSELEGNTR